jgi:hypothetical protein
MYFDNPNFPMFIRECSYISGTTIFKMLKEDLLEDREKALYFWKNLACPLLLDMDPKYTRYSCYADSSNIELTILGIFKAKNIAIYKQRKRTPGDLDTTKFLNALEEFGPFPNVESLYINPILINPLNAWTRHIVNNWKHYFPNLKSIKTWGHLEVPCDEGHNNFLPNMEDLSWEYSPTIRPSENVLYIYLPDNIKVRDFYVYIPNHKVCDLRIKAHNFEVTNTVTANKMEHLRTLMTVVSNTPNKIRVTSNFLYQAYAHKNLTKGSNLYSQRDCQFTFMDELSGCFGERFQIMTDSLEEVERYFGLPSSQYTYPPLCGKVDNIYATTFESSGVPWDLSEFHYSDKHVIRSLFGE